MYIEKNKLELAIDLARINPKLSTGEILTLLDVSTHQYDEKTTERTEFDRKNDHTHNDHDEQQKTIASNKRRRKKWDVPEDAELIRLHDKGLSNKDIAEKLERSLEAVSKRKTHLANDDQLDNQNASKRYSDYELYVIRSLYNEHDDDVNDIPQSEINEVARKLERTSGAIKTQLYYIQKLINIENKKENAK